MVFPRHTRAAFLSAPLLQRQRAVLVLLLSPPPPLKMMVVVGGAVMFLPPSPGRVKSRRAAEVRWP